MQKTLAAATLAVALGCGAASAADVYTSGGLKDAPIIPVSSWTGFYIGANIGAGWKADDSIVTVDVEHRRKEEIIDPIARGSLSETGALGGGEIGYNIQKGPFVFGIEFTIDASNIRDKAVATASAGTLLGTASAKSELDYLGTFVGRVGYLIMPNTLVFATGGLAFGEVRDSLAVSAFRWGKSVSAVASRDETDTGYTVGGGAEIALNPSWSFKVEYKYADLDKAKLSKIGYEHCGNLVAGSLDAEHTYHTVLVGLNYHVGSTYEPLK
jgi:outer membrane immunogenic protein